MNARHTSTPTVETTKLTPRQSVSIKLEALLTWVASAAVTVGAVVLASEFGEPRILLLWGVAVFLAIRAHLLWREVHDGPTLARRLWWRLVAWRSARAMQPKPEPAPFRRVKVGQHDEVFIPRQPGEMKQKQETPFIGHLTRSDVWAIVCDAWGRDGRTLSDRQWMNGTVSLPSGHGMSREDFRRVKLWLHSQSFAVNNRPAGWRLKDNIALTDVLNAMGWTVDDVP